MKKYRVLLLSLGLLVGAFVFAPVQSAAATGQCSTIVWLKDQEQSSNGWILCNLVNEANVENPEPGQNIGPLHDDAYHSDFDTLTYRSGISYILYSTNAPASNRVCMYSGTNYSGVLVWQSAVTGNVQNKTFQTEYEPGSIKWVGGIACPSPT